MAEAKKPESTAVIDYMAELNALAVATTEAEKPSGNWISFKSGILSVNGIAMKGNKAPVVVIHSIFENQLYADKYDPNNLQPPICYAFAEKDEDLKPHPDSSKPQAASCAECPKNVWGSDPGGGKGKACKNVRRLAMISSNDLEEISKAEVALAKLPVTSVKNWSSYANQIANVLKIPPLAVITEISTEPDAKTQFQVNFQLVDKIEDGEKIKALLGKRRDTTPLIFAPYDKPTQVTESAAAKKF
jgi:hypothetical protein